MKAKLQSEQRIEKLIAFAKEEVKNDDVAMFASDDDLLIYEHFYIKGHEAASQFKSQLPIAYCQNAIEGREQCVGGYCEHCKEYYKPLIESQPLPIEEVEREQFSIEDMIGFAEFLDPSDCTPEWYKRRISDWLATRKS